MMKKLSAFVVLLLLVAGPACALDAAEELPPDILDRLAEQMTTDDEAFVQADSEREKVDMSIINRAWNATPFSTNHFLIPVANMQTVWHEQMRAMHVPYPSADYLRERLEAFPELKKEIIGFDGDYEALSHDILKTWQAFFHGNFEEAYRQGNTLGLYGKFPGLLAQIVYGMYLTDTQSEKQMFMQHVVDQVAAYRGVLKQMKDDPRFRQDYAIVRLGHAYALARLAEEVPVRTAIARNYLMRLKSAVRDVLAIDPSNPVALGLRGGVDGNLMRVLGRPMALMAFGARHNVAEEYFNHALTEVDDFAVIRMEYANSILYRYKARQIDKALAHLEHAARVIPQNAMELLDVAYARKRLYEVQALQESGKEFGRFDKARRQYATFTGVNMHNVQKPFFDIREEYEYD